MSETPATTTAIREKLQTWWARRAQRRLNIDPQIEADIVSLANLLDDILRRLEATEESDE